MLNKLVIIIVLLLLSVVFGIKYINCGLLLIVFFFVGFGVFIG